MSHHAPLLSVVIPTFNNAAAIGRCLTAWERYAGDQPVELIVVEDGCRDSTPQLLEERSRSSWGRRCLRWVHEDNVHELRATNRGFREARAPLVLAWQDDMFLQVSWLVPELLRTFEQYSDLGLLCLSRGLDCLPVDEPIRSWEDLVDWRRLQSTIGPRPLNWIRLQEVDIVIRPWAVRRTCLDAVGSLDEAFVPTEWDEADLSYRIRRANWKVATHGYERLGAYFHLGSTTVGVLSDAYKQRVVKNGLLFHDRWDEAIRRDAARARRTWWRRPTAAGWVYTGLAAARSITGAIGGRNGDR
jgi:glycosyltransferase involved in cell wall biosynthesis